MPGSACRAKILGVFLLSGALAGLGGSLFVAGPVGALDPRSLDLGLGFTGIIVAALARLNPIAIVPVAIFMGALNNAGPALQSIGVPPETVTMLQGAILVFAVAGRVLHRQPGPPSRGRNRRPDGNASGGDMNDWWWVSTVAFGISLGTPLLFGTVGEIIAERSGILNLGVQGTMLVGAVAGFWATFESGSLFLGVIAAVLAGAAHLDHPRLLVDHAAGQPDRLRARP